MSTNPTSSVAVVVPADPEIASPLQIQAGDPTMYLEQVAYLADGTPLEFSRDWFRGDRFKLSASLKRTRPTRTNGSLLQYAPVAEEALTVGPPVPCQFAEDGAPAPREP